VISERIVLSPITFHQSPITFHYPLGASMSTAFINGITIGYDDSGQGEDILVLIHGHPFNRSMWEPQVEVVGRSGWRVIAPDLRGYGASSVVPGKTTLDVFACDIVALLDQLDLRSVAIGGLSMGGRLSWSFAGFIRIGYAEFCWPRPRLRLKRKKVNGAGWRWRIAS
jgi:predicted alpha/beta-fold hydrolase